MSIYQFRPEDAIRFADEQGIRVTTSGDELKFAECPYCRQKTTKKYKFAINLKSGAFNCLRASCGAKGNMLTLAKDFGFSLGRDVDAYIKQDKTSKVRKYPRPETRPAAVEYMESRGISERITKDYAITTLKDDENVLVFPFFDEGGTMQFVKYRRLDFDKEKHNSKEWCERDCKPILFGMDHCNTKNDTLIITEGQIDSLSVTEAGIENAVSVPNGKNGFTWVPYCWEFMQQFKTLVVFGDHERDEITLLPEMRQRFRHGIVKHVRLEDYRDCKDANELLQRYGKQAIRDAIENAVIVKHPLIKDLADVERKDISQLESMDTGFPELNRTIGGFFFGQLIVISGERGLGKSTLASQFMTLALNQGYTTFAYSGELDEWYFQSWFDRQVAGPDHVASFTSNLGFTDFRVQADNAEKIHEWYRGKCYIFDNKALVGENEEEKLMKVLENAILQYGCRVILVDNLMTAMEDDVTSDLYRLQASFVRNLAEIAKKYNVIIFLIAHPRKTSGRFTNNDISGSSNITDRADVVMYYTRPEEGSDRSCDRVLDVTKNRRNGRITHGGIDLFYDERSKRIAEEPEFKWVMGWQQGQAEEPAWETLNEFDEIPF